MRMLGRYFEEVMALPSFFYDALYNLRDPCVDLNAIQADSKAER
jgi:hypothetical protein